jgi:5'-phosphate synthase pdxT subunit
MKTVGVLALQGSFLEHLQMLNKIDGVKPIQVKNRDDLENVDGLILPGGESTTQGKLLRDFELMAPLREKIEKGLPVWGTCAGMILLAKQIQGGELPHLRVMDITVRRNAYGGQLDSFSDTAIIPGVLTEPFPLVFIRAPWIESAGNGVQRLAVKDGKIIAARERNLLATSFHPELTDNAQFHKYFLSIL